VSWYRYALIVGVLALAAAGAVALYSRTPAEVRAAVPPPDATDPVHGARFGEEQIARHAAFRAPSYLAFLFAALLPIAAALLLARGPFSALARRAEALPGGWPVHAAVLALAITVLLAVVALPLQYVRGFAMQQAWGLSTQDSAAWFLDQARGLLVAGVIAIVSAVAFFGVVRAAPRTWWLWGWGTFSLLTVLLVFLYPVAIAPLFNRFTPLEDPSLVARIKAFGEAVGVPIDEVQVSDASKRTTAENAYVAGLGATKRMVLYDTLVESNPEDEIAFVAAHELGHRAENHVVKGVLISSLGLLAGFAALYLLARNGALWRWGGAPGVADVRALPLLLAFLLVSTLVLLPLENALSRRFESRADAIALELTGDPDPAVRAFRGLAFKNIADLDPPGPIVWTLFTHPPIPERIRSFLSAPP
jgi:STE24 endopeptidase